VLDRDFLTLPAEAIHETRVAATYVGGALVYEA
jgi:predicted amidohydrolase YtcJ